MGGAFSAQGTPGLVECPCLRPAHVCADHRTNGGNPVACGIGALAIAAIDGVRAGVPAGASEPGSLSAHTVVAAQNCESSAHSGFDGPAQPWCLAGAPWGAAGPPLGGGASGV